MLVVLVCACWLPRYGTPWKLFVIAASCYFYGQWSYHYLGLIIVIATVDFILAQRINISEHPKKLLLCSILVNLGVLAFFKYANFVMQSISDVSAAIGGSYLLTPVDIILPVGISFYTFQNMSYTIDVYRGQLKPRTSILDYLTFSTFFPQLLAGPIVRASEFFGQLDKVAPIVWRDLQYGLVLIVCGYLKKIVLADNLSTPVDVVFSAPKDAGSWDALLAVYAFAFQIYFDFSGYTDIAIGLALLFGFKFPKNFDYPYLASSFQAFWRRWHMTLSRWLRDYLYIPLGGKRLGASRTVANLMTTMLLGGLWHGASWNFVVWGGLHGLYLAVERTLQTRSAFWRSETSFAKLIRAIIVFHFICFAWIFFRAADFQTAWIVIQKIAGVFAERPKLDKHAFLFVGLMFLAALHYCMAQKQVKERLADINVWLFGVFVAAAVLVLIWFTPAKTVPFIYFQF